MDLLNATKMPAAYTMGMRPDGRELLVVVVKGTFDIPRDLEQTPRLSQEQTPLVMADEFTGEPGFSATTVEADFVPAKPKAEVLLNGSAYAPGEEPVKEVEVGLRVGSVAKTFRVIGDRVWEQGLMGPIPSQPKPFAQMPISYDVAFGGLDDTDDPANHTAYPKNPIGRGYHNRPQDPSVLGRPLPNTEELSAPVKNPRTAYQPMSFGPWGRSWPPRIGYAGTYDDQWLEDQFPFLPPDFDERYYQSGPEDQQLDELKGDELVELKNLTPEGVCQFKLPNVRVPVEFVRRDFESIEQDARLDTLLIDSDKKQCSLVWRACMPLRKNMFEMNMVVVGKMPRGWYRARSAGKTYYRNLDELIAGSN